MESFIETVLRLDANNDLAGLHEFVRGNPPKLHEMLDVIFQLLSKVRMQSSFVLALILANAGFKHINISLALIFSGMFLNKPEEEKRGMENLSAQTEMLTIEQKTYFFNHIITPVMAPMLVAFLENADHVRVLRLLDVLKILDPRFRTLFDWDAPVPEFSLAKLRQRGREQARIINYPLPPSGVPRQQQRVLVTGRETVFMRPDSRFNDLGPRITLAMNNYGWQAEFYGLNSSVDWWSAIPAICRQKKSDVLLLEDGLMVGNALMKGLRAKMIAQLRQDNPSLKIVGYLLDSWLKPTVFKETSALLDLVWDFSAPSLSIWQDPTVAKKVICLPCPSANICTPKQPLLSHMLFAGSVKGWNWHRAFWLSAIDRLKIPIKHSLSTHSPDGLSIMESYGLYMRRLADATCCFNLTMRPDIDHTCIVTGRSFETILSGSLLVQETTPDMHCFFVSGEHYLEFASLAELSSITQFITEHKEEAEEIRRCGNAFAREHYSEEKLVGYLDKALFFPD